ncbi:MAG TPA: hypothetical protein VM661_05500 [Candidatus Sulfotelmatobacter sp.]|jgi:hypothetical protein|nr:hypothetical protein [Candidatus Sulfotelmatobacter sp.]
MMNAQGRNIPCPGFGEDLPNLTFGCSFSSGFDLKLAGGRYVALSFLGTAAHPAARRVIEELYRTLA